MSDLRPTPFHVRSARLSRGNRWTARNGWLLAADYGDAHAEALAARMSAVMADITSRWRIRIEGARAAEFLSRLCTKDVSALEPGASVKTLWLSDGGGVRGAGVVARFGAENFLLAASSSDIDWISRAASAFDVHIRDVSQEEAGLALIGPSVPDIWRAAGLDASIEPLEFRKLFWQGLDIALSRLGEHGGYEIWCARKDAPSLWDCITSAGENFGLLPAGATAMDILDIERGVARPVRDYEPARDGFAATPTPRSLGLENLIDTDHTIFNGRAAYLAAREKEVMRLTGIEFDSETKPVTKTLHSGNRSIGTILATTYSPALRRIIALAQVEAAFSVPKTALSLTSTDGPATARVVELPFLANPA